MKLLQDKAIKYGLIGIAGVVVLIIGLLIPVGHGDKEIQRLEADIDSLKIAVDSLKIAVSITENRTLPSYDDSEIFAMYERVQSQLNDFATRYTGDCQALKTAVDDNAARLSEQQGYISALELTVHDLKQMGGLDSDTVKALQASFADLSERFAVVLANDKTKVTITDAIIGGTGYINNDMLLAEVLVIIENPTIFNVTGRGISLAIKADKDCPPIRSATLGGLYGGGVWNYQFTEGRYIYFVTANPVDFMAGTVTGFELKLKLTFTSPLTSITSFEAEAQIN